MALSTALVLAAIICIVSSTSLKPYVPKPRFPRTIYARPRIRCPRKQTGKYFTECGRVRRNEPCAPFCSYGDYVGIYADCNASCEYKKNSMKTRRKPRYGKVCITNKPKNKDVGKAPQWCRVCLQCTIYGCSYNCGSGCRWWISKL